MMHYKVSRYKWMLVVSMIIFGTIGLFVRKVPLGSSEIALYRGIIAVITLFIIRFFAKSWKKEKKNAKEYLFLFLSGGAMGVNWALLFEAYRNTSIALSTLSYYFAPTIVLVISILLFKERPSMFQLFCFFIATTGLVLVIGAGREEGEGYVGILYGLGAAFFYAILILFNRKRKSGDELNDTFFQLISGVLVLLIYVVVRKEFRLAEITIEGFVYLLIIGVIHTGLAYYLYFSSLPGLSGYQAGLLSYIDPLTAIFLSVAILGERISLIQLIGGGLILFFTILSEIPKKKTVH